MGSHVIILVCLRFASLGCSQAQPVRGLFGWSKAQHIKLAATSWAPVLEALSIFKELVLAVPHSSRDDSVVSSRDERQPAQIDDKGTM